MKIATIFYFFYSSARNYQYPTSYHKKEINKVESSIIYAHLLYIWDRCCPCPWLYLCKDKNVAVNFGLLNVLLIELYLFCFLSFSWIVILPWKYRICVTSSWVYLPCFLICLVIIGIVGTALSTHYSCIIVDQVPQKLRDTIQSLVNKSIADCRRIYNYWVCVCVCVCKLFSPVSTKGNSPIIVSLYERLVSWRGSNYICFLNAKLGQVSLLVFSNINISLCARSMYILFTCVIAFNEWLV